MQPCSRLDRNCRRHPIWAKPKLAPPRTIARLCSEVETDRRCGRMSDPTIDRSSLPIRRPPFGGVTKKTLEGSVPDWNQASKVTPPEGAPNVLVVLIDDAGFGNPSTFGGPIETPNYTRVAEQGLRFNRFHVTAVCSPTRAASLTVRDRDRVGFRLVGASDGKVASLSDGWTCGCVEDKCLSVLLT